jgi:hypothetical protein
MEDYYNKDVAYLYVRDAYQEHKTHVEECNCSGLDEY